MQIGERLQALRLQSYNFHDEHLRAEFSRQFQPPLKSKPFERNHHTTLTKDLLVTVL